MITQWFALLSPESQSKQNEEKAFFFAVPNLIDSKKNNKYINDKRKGLLRIARGTNSSQHASLQLSNIDFVSLERDRECVCIRYLQLSDPHDAQMPLCFSSDK